MAHLITGFFVFSGKKNRCLAVINNILEYSLFLFFQVCEYQFPEDWLKQPYTAFISKK